MSKKDEIKKFEDDIRNQIEEAAKKLTVEGDAPCPGAILAMLGYQMYLDKFYLNPDRIKKLIEYLMLGHEMAREDEKSDLQGLN